MFICRSFATLLVFSSLTTLSHGQNEGPMSEAASLVVIGKQLFFDRRLSANQAISCASCHAPEHAFSDQRPSSIGSTKRALTRNAPSLLDVKDRKTLFWDGRTSELEQQASMPLLNPLEHGFANEQELLNRIRAIPDYTEAFARLRPSAQEPIQLQHVNEAIAAYERTLVTKTTAFDLYFQSSNETPLPPAVQRGWALFSGSARCIQCHTADGKKPSFTDDRFHVSPVKNTRNLELGRLTQLVKAAQLGKDPKLLDQLITNDPGVASLGRFAVSHDPSDIRSFRTPSLRNVARTAPYMHDGSVATLEQAVELELYRTDSGLRRPLPLSVDEKKDLVVFLKALNDPD